MPYTASLSRIYFLRQTDDLIRYTKIKSNKKSATIPSDVMQLLFQAAIFRTSALLEEYLKDSISDWLSLASRHGHTCSTIPTNLKWFIVSRTHGPSYKEYYLQNDEKKLLEKLNSMSSDGFMTDTQPLTGLLNLSSIVGDRKYPSPKNIKALFNRVGIHNIFHHIDSITHRNTEMSLQSFLDVRGAIAHQNPQLLNYPEVTMHIRNVQGLVRAIDRILYKHVIAHNGGSCWRTV
jgi:hypothetical protein